MSAKKSEGFTAEERAAMRERAKELKAEARKADGERAVLAKIAEMQGPDRGMAERLHEIVKASAPALSPKTWYGMPASAAAFVIGVTYLILLITFRSVFIPLKAVIVNILSL